MHAVTMKFVYGMLNGIFGVSTPIWTYWLT